MNSYKRNIDKILAFYGGSGCDHRGRTFDEILRWNYEALELTHDYIQWLFPLTAPSRFNTHAPVLSPGNIQHFRDTAQLRTNLLKSFKLLLDFYGFELNGMSVDRSENFPVRADNWLTVGNHNMLRISRILTCLSILGLRAYAISFLEALTAVYKENPSVIQESYEFWEKAVAIAK